jgi:hypothetical protein
MDLRTMGPNDGFEEPQIEDSNESGDLSLRTLEFALGGPRAGEFEDGLDTEIGDDGSDDDEPQRDEFDGDEFA